MLVKVSADGKKRVKLCMHLKKFICFSGSLIYYTDYLDTLHSVRIDGKNDISISKNIDKVYPIGKYLYYTRKEKIEDETRALSIYRMDNNGRNVRKVMFNVDKVDVDGKEKLYFKKEEIARFKVYEPKKEKEAVLIDYPLKKYYAMDLGTEEVSLVLTVGLPHSEERKTGCGGKKTTVDKVYEEVPWTASYEE